MSRRLHEALKSYYNAETNNPDTNNANTNSSRYVNAIRGEVDDVKNNINVIEGKIAANDLAKSFGYEPPNTYERKKNFGGKIHKKSRSKSHKKRSTRNKRRNRSTRHNRRN